MNVVEALKNSILATVAYYDSLDIALTPLEIFQLLINPKRWGEDFEKQPQLIDVINLFGELVSVNRLVSCNGYFMFPGRQDLYERRVEREKISAQKWKKLLRLAWWFQTIPFLQGIFASGSLALEGAGEKSDFDVLVIARAGRLYTCRLILSGLASLMGARRTWRDKVAPDKFCFNHYVTTDGLGIRHRSLYVAHGLAALVPVMDRGYTRRLAQANEWVQDFLPPLADTEYVRRSVRPSRILSVVRGILEVVLNAWPERLLRAWQQRRIARTPATHEKGGRIIADDRELEFHPRSFETTALARYHEALIHAGLGNYREHDSGLTT